MIDPTERDITRFWSKVDKTGDCWLWTAATTPSGYGNFTQRSKYVAAHRFAYTITFGAIPEGLFIDHLCHTKACVKPDHLRTATRMQNGQNRNGAAAHCRSGVRGVFWHKANGRWSTHVGHNGKSHYAGSYDNIADAEAAVIALRNKLFTHNQD